MSCSPEPVSEVTWEKKINDADEFRVPVAGRVSRALRRGRGKQEEGQSETLRQGLEQEQGPQGKERGPWALGAEEGQGAVLRDSFRRSQLSDAFLLAQWGLN